MKRTKQIAIIAGLFLLLTAVVIFLQPSIFKSIATKLLEVTTTGEYKPQHENAPIALNGIPFGADGHFVIIQLSENTFAIGEPSAWTRNFSYLLLGSERALLFDAGIGQFNIRPVIASLTDLPLTFMPSHFHYDHTGQGDYERIAIIDLPHIRKQADGNTLTLTSEQHLGFLEGIPLPTWEISDWVKAGSFIDLGKRQLQLIYTPGHTDNSVSLLDKENNMMFTGDYIERGRTNMLAHAPTGNMGDYLQTAVKLLDLLAASPELPLHPAHGLADGSDNGEVPVVYLADVQLLHDQLLNIKNGDLKPSMGTFPIIYVLGNDMFLEADPSYLQNWTETFPDNHDAHNY